MWRKLYTWVTVISGTLIFIWLQIMNEYWVLDTSSKRLKTRIVMHMIVTIQGYSPCTVLRSDLKPSYITNTFSACESLHCSPQWSSVTLKVEVVHSSKPLEQTKYTTWCRYPKEDLHLKWNCCEQLKIYIKNCYECYSVLMSGMSRMQYFNWIQHLNEGPSWLRTELQGSSLW
jgi:hypothetical protein